MADTRYTNDPTRNAGAKTTHDPTVAQGGEPPPPPPPPKRVIKGHGFIR